VKQPMGIIICIGSYDVTLNSHSSITFSFLLYLHINISLFYFFLTDNGI